MFPAIEQIDYLRQSWISLTGFSANGSSGNPTTQMGTALNTAGKGGTVLPNQVGSSSAMGWVTSGNNIVLIFDSSSKEGIKDAQGNRVYARLTGSNPYTLSYFAMAGATETTYSFAAAIGVDLFLPYVYQAGRMPIDIDVRISQYAGFDFGSIGGATQPAYFTQSLTIAIDNTVPVLSKAPSSTSGVFLMVRGIVYHSNGSTPAFTVGGTSNKTVTWSETNARFMLKAGWDVIAFYPTLE